MDSQNKLSDEDLSKIKELYSEEARYTSELGYIERELRILEENVNDLKKRKEEIFKGLTQVEDSGEELENKLKEKYNASGFDYQSGEVLTEDA